MMFGLLPFGLFQMDYHNLNYNPNRLHRHLEYIRSDYLQSVSSREGFSISGWVLDKLPGSGSGSGRVGVSKNMIGYFWVSFLLSGISRYFGYFWVCRVFSGISGFTHIY